MTYKAHDFDAFGREVALGALSRQHDAVGAVKDRVGDVAGLGACRTRLVRHAVQHLHHTHTHTVEYRYQLATYCQNPTPVSYTHLTLPTILRV